MVHWDGYVKVLDFGLARELTGDEDRDGASKTELGRPLGTPRYMSPEQARGERAGPASDIFSLGLSLYELATGVSSYLNRDAGDCRPLLPASRVRPDIPVGFDALIEQMLQLSPDRRPTAVEIADALKDLTRRAVTLPVPFRARRSVGRRHELDELRKAWNSASDASGLVVCVSGEPGMGKTTLVEEFLAQIEAEDPQCVIARGRCSQLLAGAEAYLAIFELLESLVGNSQGDTAKRLLKALAPSWYAQLALPADVSDGDARNAPSAERFKREFVRFLQELCRLRTVVLFIDDLHWSDVATADLLAYLGARLSDQRLLVIATFRPTEMAVGEHRFLGAKQELQSKDLCREIGLTCLSRAEVGELVSAELPGRLPAGFESMIFSRTEGIPLFASDMLRYLRERGLIINVVGGWECARPLAEMQCELPRSVQCMIETKLARLSKEDRRLLAAASVQGAEFEVGIASQLVGLDVIEADERLYALSNTHGLVRSLPGSSLLHGHTSVRYAFVHALYQNALHKELAPLRKIAWSRQTAQALLDQSEGRHDQIAAQLALLYEAANQPEQAAQHFLTAASNAASMFAYREAASLAERGLAQLVRTPESADRSACELQLQLALGRASQPTSGFGSEVAGTAYRRAVHLSANVGPSVQRFHALWGLWFYHVVRLDLSRAQELAYELLQMACDSEIQELAPYGHRACQMTLAHQGEFIAAEQHFRAVLPWLESQPSGESLNNDFEAAPGIPCLAYASWTSWPLGYPDTALRCIERAIARARTIAHRQSLCTALYFAAILHQRRGDAVRTHESVEELFALGETDFAAWTAWAAVLRGWAQSAMGDPEEGIAQMRRALAGLENMQTGTGKQRGYCLLAHALVETGQTAEAQSLVNQALLTLERTREFAFESDVFRTQGDILADEHPREAETWYRRAVESAQRQHAKSFELHALTHLTRLLNQEGRAVEAQQLLQPCFDWFTEGLDTARLKEAQTLLKYA
jgi:tetratricopeptide (TPR) repeat protein